MATVTNGQTVRRTRPVRGRLDVELAALIRGRSAREDRGGVCAKGKCAAGIRAASAVVNVTIVVACAATLAFQTSHCLLRSDHLRSSTLSFLYRVICVLPNDPLRDTFTRTLITPPFPGAFLIRNHPLRDRYLTGDTKAILSVRETGDATFLAFTVCPSYDDAYKEDLLRELGLSRSQYKDGHFGDAEDGFRFFEKVPKFQSIDLP